MESVSRAGDVHEQSDVELVHTLQVHHGDHSSEENEAMRELMYP